MRVLWTHTFNTDIDENAGIFMFNAAERLKSIGLDLTLEYLGDLRSPRRIINSIKYLNKISKNFDLVHAQYGSGCGLVTSTIKSCPIVLSLRGSDWNLHNTSFKYDFWHTIMARFLTKISISKYDYIISVSKRMTKDLKGRYPSLKFLSMPSPIDLGIFKPIEKIKARELLGFPNNNERWILFTAGSRNNPIKRYSLARKATLKANLKLKNLKLRIAENIPHSEISTFVAACDMVLCTSDSEGWPNSVKEALACNLPFISTDVSDLSLISEKESNCRVCPPDANIIAENICDVFLNPINNNLRSYILPMDISKSNETIMNFYLKLLDNTY